MCTLVKMSKLISNLNYEQIDYFFYNYIFLFYNSMYVRKILDWVFRLIGLNDMLVFFSQAKYSFVKIVLDMHSMYVQSFNNVKIIPGLIIKFGI